MSTAKTNAMRILDSEQISYQSYHYENKDGKIDGISVAEKIKKPVEMVYKTLVAKDNGEGIHVFVIPVAKELDLKKAAKVVKAKKVELIHVKDIQKWTGYIRGGCSPIGMKRLYNTVIDETAKSQPAIIVSAGKIGQQVELNVEDLIRVTKGTMADIIHG